MKRYRKRILATTIIAAGFIMCSCGTTTSANENQTEEVVNESDNAVEVLDKKVEIALENLESYENTKEYSIIEIDNIMTYEDNSQLIIYIDYILNEGNISDSAILCLNQKDEIEWCYCSYSSNEYHDMINTFSYDDFLEYDKYKLEDKYKIGLSRAEKEKNLIVEAATIIQDNLLNRDSLQIQKAYYLETGVGTAEGIVYLEYSAQNKMGGYSNGSCFFKTTDWIITEMYDENDQYMQQSIKDIYGDYTWTEYNALEIEELVNK